jgi:hypothetical protein
MRMKKKTILLRPPRKRCHSWACWETMDIDFAKNETDTLFFDYISKFYLSTLHHQTASHLVTSFVSIIKI